MEHEYMSHFPTALKPELGKKYMVVKGRNLFGNRRHGVTLTENPYTFVNDFHTKQEAIRAVKTYNLYNELWDMYENNRSKIKRLARKIKDISGYSDRSIMGLIVHSEPKLIAYLLT